MQWNCCAAATRVHHLFITLHACMRAFDILIIKNIFTNLLCRSLLRRRSSLLSAESATSNYPAPGQWF